MRKLLPYVLLPILVLLLGSYNDPAMYSLYKPIFMLRAEMEANVRLSEPRIILEPGKIYLKDHLIFINEKYKGIHVLDNSDPKSPKKIGFIVIDGCIDMAVKDDVLYADNAVDLIAVKFDMAMTEITVTERINDVFPELLSPDGRSLYWSEQQAIPEDAILVNWEKR